MSRSKPNKRHTYSKISFLAIDKTTNEPENLSAKNQNDELKFRLVKYIETLIILDRQRLDYEKESIKHD